MACPPWTYLELAGPFEVHGLADERVGQEEVGPVLLDCEKVRVCAVQHLDATTRYGAGFNHVVSGYLSALPSNL